MKNICPHIKAKGLPEAKEKLRIDNLEKAEKEEYNRFIKNRRIQENEITTAKQDGYIKAEKKYKPILEEERRQKEEERRQKEEERRQKEIFMLKLAKKMIKFGETIEEIMQETGLTKEVIEEFKPDIDCVKRYSMDNLVDVFINSLKEGGVI